MLTLEKRICLKSKILFPPPENKKVEQNKHKPSIKKRLTKKRAQINETEKGEKSMKQKADSLKRINKVVNSLARMTKTKNRKTQITSIRNEKRYITRYPAATKIIMREY